MSGLNISGIRPLPTATLAQVASDVDMAKLHYEVGREHYERKEYAEALVEFQKSYEMSGRPELYYNIALCYEKLMKPEEALSYYRRYLANDPYAPDHQEVEVRIAELEEMIEERKKTERPPAAERTPAVKRPQPPPPRAVPTQPSKPESPEIDLAKGAEEAPFAHYRTLMWSSLALSAAGLALGGIGLYQGDKKTEERADLLSKLSSDGKIVGGGRDYRFTDDEAEARYGGELTDLRDDVKMYKKIAIGGFIGGGAALVLGGIFFWLDIEQAPKQNDTGQIAIIAGPNTGGLNVGLRWGF